MFTSVTGRSVIVTGASSGIGRGIARLFGARGARVLVAARESAKAQRVVDEIVSDGGAAVACSADVRLAADTAKMVRVAVETHGGVDILCANAGIFPASPLYTMSEDEWDNVIDTNLKGTFLSIKETLPALKTTGRGRIIITSSITGPLTGYPGWAHYAASKAGQLGLMRTAAMELAPFNITVNAVMPGNVHTEGLDGLGQEYLKRMTASIPQQRLGSVEDIAHAVLYFASDEAAYVTGQTLVVDGGQVLPESRLALEDMAGTGISTTQSPR